MAISIWFVLVVLALVARMAASRIAATRAERRATNRKTPSDQIRPRPRHYPLVDARVYS